MARTPIGWGSMSRQQSVTRRGPILFRWHLCFPNRCHKLAHLNAGIVIVDLSSGRVRHQPNSAITVGRHAPKAYTHRMHLRATASSRSRGTSILLARQRTSSGSPRLSPVPRCEIRVVSPDLPHGRRWAMFREEATPNSGIPSRPSPARQLPWQP